MSDLGDDLAAELEAKEGVVGEAFRVLRRSPNKDGMNAEEYFSFPAEPPLWLNPIDRSAAELLFTHVRGWIARQIFEAQEGFVATEWLRDLVGWWFRDDDPSRAPCVIGLNYDTLIERALGECMDDPFAYRRLHPFPILNRCLEPPGELAMGRLMKLHGSLHLYASLTGDQLFDVDVQVECEGDDLADFDHLAGHAGGMVPMVVPPTSNKATFYSAPFLRTVWQQAARALANASEVWIVGYSLPHEDYMIR